MLGKQAMIGFRGVHRRVGRVGDNIFSLPAVVENFHAACSCIQFGAACTFASEPSSPCEPFPSISSFSEPILFPPPLQRHPGDVPCDHLRPAVRSPSRWAQVRRKEAAVRKSGTVRFDGTAKGRPYPLHRPLHSRRVLTRSARSCGTRSRHRRAISLFRSVFGPRL